MDIKKSLIIAAFAASGAYAQNGTTLKTGIDLGNLDRAAKPGTSFYEYACGGWMKQHPLPAEYSRYGSFELVYENSERQLKDLIIGLSEQQNAQGSLGQKIGDLYRIAMDSMKLNRDGYTPIKGTLAEIAAVNTRAEVQPMMARLARQGVSGMFGTYIDADIKNSAMNLVQISQGGLSLGQKEYYLDTDEATVKIREAFKKHIVKMFELCGFPKTDAEKKMQAVMEIETRIAKPSYSATQQRDPEANYHKMSYKTLQSDYAGIDWDGYFGALGMKGFADLSVSQPEPIHEVEKILQDEPVESLKAFMEWKLISAASSCLSDDLRAEAFDFGGRIMSGRQKDRDRWKRAVSTVNGTLGEAVGKLYVEKYFPAAAKERMVQLVKNLQTALGERIEAQEWMSDETKKVALDKLAAFYIKVGYPDKWRSYDGLDIRNDSYWANMVRSNEFDLAYEVEKKLNKPVDRDEWYMTPQTVNAYYNPTTNEICFPAGILQYPFFDMEADDAFNYGAIGVVIGHEMTHGFDDQGRQFDKNGNLTDWWHEGDADRFKARASVMAKFFSNISVLSDLKGNGDLTLGENLADHGGLMVAYQAFKNATRNTSPKTVDGFTPDQRFFLAYANVWAANIRDEEIRVRTKSDSHSLGRWRVDGALPHIDAWYQAFGIGQGDSMFVPKEERVTIW